MSPNQNYIDLKGRVIRLEELDPAEKALIANFQEFAIRHTSSEYHNHWLAEVARFYGERGLSRAQTTQTTVFRVGQDLGSRLMIAEGIARAPDDYRDELQELIQTRFPSQRAFCEVTGLAEDMLSHVLARRKHLSIDALTQALGRVGYRLHIAPIAATTETKG